MTDDKFLHDPVVLFLEIKIGKSGALCVSGSIEDEAFVVTALQSAIDAIRRHHKKQRVLIVPGIDTGLVCE
jgi:hypothetical protein